MVRTILASVAMFALVTVVSSAPPRGNLGNKQNGGQGSKLQQKKNDNNKESIKDRLEDRDKKFEGGSVKERLEDRDKKFEGGNRDKKFGGKR